jgi:hypothetical protein
MNPHGFASQPYSALCGWEAFHHAGGVHDRVRAVARASKRFPCQSREALIVKDFDQSHYGDTIAGLRCAVERHLRAHAHFAVISKVGQAWSRSKVGKGGQARRDQGLRVVKFRVRHQIEPWSIGANILLKAVEITERVLDLEVGKANDLNFLRITSATR